MRLQTSREKTKQNNIFKNENRNKNEISNNLFQYLNYFVNIATNPESCTVIL